MQRSMLGFVAGLVGLILSGCSTITQGTDQDITVNTNPAGATCTLERQGQRIGTVENTPATITVSKLKYDITIVCNKEGYQTATYINDSGWESGSGAAGIALDVVLTLGVSSAIDSATGADNRYESPVNITLLPAQQNVPQTRRPYNTPAIASGAEIDESAVFTTSINWSEHRLVRGSIEGFSVAKDVGIFNLKTENPSWSCSGEWWPSKPSQRSTSYTAEGQWKMDCLEKGVASGFYGMDSATKGAFRGTDSRGDYVEILILEKKLQTSEVFRLPH